MAEDIYLDYAAGTPINNSALKEALAVGSKYYAHPEAIHQPALEVADKLKDYRRQLAKILAVSERDLFFVAGATEANNLLALSLRKTYPKSRLAALSIDHDSLKSNADCLIDVDSRTAQITEAAMLEIPDDVCCLSLAGINSETGVIQPWRLIKKSLIEIQQRRLRQGINLPLLLHVDGSQMPLVHKIQPQALASADMLTLNGGKIYALNQSGILYVNAALGLVAPFNLGSSMNFKRPGTPSLVAAAALLKAVAYVEKNRHRQVEILSRLQAYFEEGLTALGGEIVLAGRSLRSPHITSVIFNGQDNETLAMKLSLRGIHVGIGSACNSKENLISKSALSALGYQPSQVLGSLRFSFGYQTTKKQLATTLKTLKDILRS